MKQNTISLLFQSVEPLLAKIDEIENAAMQDLDERGNTPPLNAIECSRIQRALLFSGFVSLFESIAAEATNGCEVWKELDRKLRANKLELAEAVKWVRTANNALKHGEGRSFDLIVKHTTDHGYAYKKEDYWFDGEGDATEPDILINVSSDDVRFAVKTLEEAFIEMRTEL